MMRYNIFVNIDKDEHGWIFGFSRQTGEPILGDNQKGARSYTKEIANMIADRECHRSDAGYCVIAIAPESKDL